MAHPSELLNLRWTKLSPPRTAGDLVRRARVRELLDRSLEHSLTLVCAPAGYGKTTLLSDWLADSGHPYVWLSLDESDNDLVVFLSYFVTAIRTVYTQACTNTLGLLAAPELPPPTRLANALANDLEALPCQPGPADGRCCILVLDDYHIVHNEAISALLGEIWRYPPRTMHLILSTRLDPNFPLDVLRARGEVSEIRMRELRFTREEVAVFMKQATGLPLDEPAVTLLAERTEGWAAGLRLAALTLTTHDDIHGHLAELPADNRYVMDYLMGEVLSHIPVATQEFLLKTSILDRLSGPLCDAVTGVAEPQRRGQDYLEWLAHAGLFTWSVDPQQQWYHCHHLFRRLLRIQLEQRHGPAEIALLHIRASAWLGGKGFVDEAMEHSLTAGDMAEAIRLVETHRHAAMNQERWLDLQRWLNRLPRQVIDEHPELVLAEAWLLHHRAALVDVSACLARAGVLMQQTPLADEARLGLQGEIDALTSQLVYWTADTERTLTLAQRALVETPIEHSYVRSIAWMFFGGALALRGDLGDAIAAVHEGLREDRFHSNTYAPRLLLTLCLIYWMAADLPQVLQTADHLLELARERNLAESVDWAQYFRGCTHYQQNDLETAARNFAAVVSEHRAAHGVLLPQSTFGLASTHQAQGLVEPARDDAATVAKYALEMNNPAMLATARAFEAHLALLQRREGVAARWVTQADRNIRTAPMPLFYVPNFTLVEILLAQGTPASLEEAARLLARLHEVVQATHNTRFLIEALALQALLYDARHERSAALDALTQAVALAEPGGVIRVFVDLGPRMAALLHQLTAQRVGPTDFVARLLAAFPATLNPAAAPHQPGLIEPLSERELEVLALLAQRLTNKEIARALNISPMTVKRHSSNIYQKLLVGGRREAVAKAAALGLVSAVPYPRLPMPAEQ